MSDDGRLGWEARQYEKGDGSRTTLFSFIRRDLYYPKRRRYSECLACILTIRLESAREKKIGMYLERTSLLSGSALSGFSQRISGPPDNHIQLSLNG